MSKGTVLVIGVGFMGKMQAGLWKQMGYDVAICDIEAKSTVWVTKEGIMCPVEWDRLQIANDIGVPFILLPKSWDEQKKILSNLHADIWNISSPTSFHSKQLLLAKKIGVKKVLLEKPVALKESEIKDVEHLATDESITIQVNYIERANQAYRVVLEYLKKCDWKPTKGLFWRQHDATDYIIAGDAPDDHPWGFLRDSSHDVSEMHGVNAVLDGNQIIPISGTMLSWQSKYPGHHKLNLASDYSSIVIFASKVAKYAIFGAKDEPREKRFFILHDTTHLIYCSTLPRQRIQPCVLYVEGEHNVNKIVSMANYSYRHMELPHDFELLEKMFIEMGGKVIFTDWESPTHPLQQPKGNPQEFMFDNLINAKSNDELISSLKHAIEIDQLVVKAYKASKMEFNP